MKNSFHSLLASRQYESLIQNLDLPQDEERQLLSCAAEIKKVISAGFAALKKEYKKNNQKIEAPTPRFAIQGSYVYRTLNDPAYPPAQQVDIDLGVYLPFSYLGNGQKPKEATSIYFQAITAMLEKHISTNRSGQWSLPPESEQKPTCIRIIVGDKTHIDLPLYAFPESELSRISDKRDLISKYKNIKSEAYAEDSAERFLFEAESMEAIDPSVIHMAHREDGWKPSDPLVIRDWIKQHFAELGPMIQPVNRFLKAWRDEVWRSDGGPSSLLLLAYTIEVFPRDTSGMNHCDVLKLVIDELPAIFDRPLLVPCPTPEDQYAKENLLKRVSPEKRAEFKAAFEHLKAKYSQAKSSSVVNANDILITLFGERLPKDPSRIEVISDDSPHLKRIVSAEPEIKPLHTTLVSTSA